MSTGNPVTPPNPAAPSPQPTAAELAAANAASQLTATPGQPTPAATPEPPSAPQQPTPDNPVITSDLGGGRFKVQYLTGETFEGTAAEVLANQGRAHVSTKLWAKQQAAQPPTPTAPVAPPSLFTDPSEEAAAEYAANLIAKKLGYPDAQSMQNALGHISETSADFSAQSISLEFQAAAPDFNQTPENSNKLLGLIAETVGDDAFGAMNREQQVKMMRQAHAFLLQTGQYQPKPSAHQPRNVPAPPPPAPTGSRPPDTGGVLPPELVVQPGDSLEVIKQKWDKAAAMGLTEARRS